MLLEGVKLFSKFVRYFLASTPDFLLPLAFLSFSLSFTSCSASKTPEKLIDSERKRSSGCFQDILT